MPPECQPQNKCALWKVCIQIAEKANPKPHEGLTPEESALSNDFNQVVDKPDISDQILGSQDDTGCIPFNHQLRNQTIGEGDLNSIIFRVLLGRELSRNIKMQASAKGWEDLYKPSNRGSGVYRRSRRRD